MKKLLIAFSALLLVFSSCSSSDDATSSNSNSVLVKRMVQNDEDGEVTTRFTYNGDKIVKGTSDDGTSMVFTYTGDLITEIKYYDGTSLDQKDIYIYDSNNRLTGFVMLSYGDDWGDKETYVYNTDGTISVTHYTGDLASQELLNDTSKIYFTNGEVSKIEEFGEDGTTITRTKTFTYDSKNNPFKNVKGYDKINFTLGFPTGILHNILTETDQTDIEQSWTNQYTYNSQDYPLIETETHLGQETSTSQYIYE